MSVQPTLSPAVEAKKRRAEVPTKNFCPGTRQGRSAN